MPLSYIKTKRQSSSRLSLIKATLIVAILQISCVLAVEYREIAEHVIYDNIQQEARTYAYYKMTVGQRYYETGEEHIAVKVIANQYDSDPDVFISKINEEPKDSTNSEWFCEREGSETCIIKNGQFEIGDTFYIGVKCDRQCRYDLRVWFTKEFNLIETDRIQLRFSGMSTQILKYYIESETEEGSPVRSIELIVNNEKPYVELDMHISLDDNFYIIEEKPSTHFVKNGVGFKFSESDNNWCVKCYIYVILNVKDEGRYYITSQGKSENDDLSESIPSEVMVNPFTQECYGYFVLRTKQDVMFTVEGYTGIADMYISARDVPDSPIYGDRIVMRGGHATQRQIIIKAQERKDYGYATGTYLLCFYAYTPFSGRVVTLENDYEGRYDYEDGVVKTQTVYANDLVLGRYKNTGLNSKAKLHLYLDTQYGKDLSNLKVTYNISINEYQYSVMAQEWRDGVEGYSQYLNLSSGYATIDHDPAYCLNIFGSQHECTYMFSIYNFESTPTVVTMYVEAEIFNPGDIDLQQPYANTVKHGQSIHYELNTYKNPDMAYLKKLKIILESYLGDADLFVSFTNPNPDLRDHDYMSRRSGDYDEVTIEEEGMLALNALNRTIYFNVFGFKKTQYIVRFEYEYLPSYNSRLESAYQIGDTQYKHEVFDSDYDEGFYKFRPWWSESENRTVAFVADVLQNKIFFYSQWNEYPKHFLTTKHDINDTIVIYGSDPDYHFTGDYYIRLRPDFALYDLMSEREYIFNMFAFSQPPANGGLYRNGFQLLELGVDQVGFSNQTNYQDYRYIIADMKANFTITLRRIPGEGNPIFFVKMMNSQDANYQYSQLPRENGYHFKSDEYPDKPWIHNLTITPDMRVSRVGRCGFVKQSLQSNGDLSCFIAISVLCEDGSDCAYHLKIDQEGYEYAEQSSKANPDFKPIPGNPILEDQYVNGNVTHNKVKYYYFPVSREDYGNSLILLNKTQIFGSGENGDSRMLINLQSDTSDNIDEGKNYTEWIYPNDNRAGAISFTLNNTLPEIIEPCEEVMTRFCQDTDGCTYVIGVVGGAPGILSSYRIKGFRGHNKLHLNKPIHKIRPNDKEGEEAFDYYWFVLNDTVLDSSVSFEYQVSVGKISADQDNDPDLYVSVVDGRRPTETDYDFKSELIGADSVTIRSNDTFWMRNGLNTSAGVTVVVGVRQPKRGEYTLVLSSPNKPIFYEDNDTGKQQEVQRLFVGSVIQFILPELADQSQPRKFSKLFQLYNWGQEDIEFQLETNRGRASLMYNTIGQDITDHNIYTGIPINQNNSLEAIKVDSNNNTVGDLNSILISGGQHCFNCWYFIKLESDDPGQVQISFSTPKRADSGGPAEIRVGIRGQIYILATLSTMRKFILDSKDSFIIEATVASGSIDMYIGLDPDTVGPDNYLWKTSTVGNLASLSVKTTDKNFHVGTYYYIYMKASQENDALINLYLKQERSVEFVPNNHDSTYGLDHGSFNDDTLFVKYQFQSSKEDIKFHVIQVPGAIKSQNENEAPIERWHKAKITIESLTPHFYPQVYLKKVQMDTQPDQLASMNFPTLNDYDVAFGEDPYPQLHSNTFEYTWHNNSERLYTYYTLAVYQNNWQLSDYRKAEYQIKAEADVVVCNKTSGECNNLLVSNSATPLEANVLKLEKHADGSVWKWLDEKPVPIEQRRAQRGQFGEDADDEVADEVNSEDEVVEEEL